MAKSHEERLVEVEERGNRYLAEANEAAERGDKVKAKKLYAKGQWWLDLYNKIDRN